MRSFAPWLAGVCVAAFIVLANDQFFFESVVITSSSMEPTLFPNERVFLQRVSFDPISRFDVVVIKTDKASRRIVKRVMGLPGECVLLRNGWEFLVKSSDLTLQPTYWAASTAEDHRIEELDGKAHPIQLRVNPQIHYETKFGYPKPFCLGPDEYYVLGDNRLASGDGRDFGAIKRSEIEGRLRMVWYSYDKKAGRLRSERFWSPVF